MKPIQEAANARSRAGAQPVILVGAHEMMRAPVAVYDAQCFEARSGYLADVIEVEGRLKQLDDRLIAIDGSWARRFTRGVMRARDERLRGESQELRKHLFGELMQPKWREVNPNTVCTGGKNDLLDKYFAGSSYTASWFCGLISSTSYSAISAGDTMASHAGWLEAGTANAPTYSNSTRVALAFSSASSGSKATSSASSFTFSGTGTIKGMFGTTVSTKDGTTGILYNAVLFTGGDRAVVSSDVVNVSVTYSV